VALCVIAMTAGVAQACAPAPTPNIPGVPVPMPDVATLERYLETAGVPHDFIGEADVAWFEVGGRFYDLPMGPEVRPEMLYVHTYEDAEAARTELSRMSPSAGAVTLRDGTKMRIEWLGSAHVFVSGPLVVVHVGNSAEVYDALTEALGPQAAGVGRPIAPPVKGGG
jgi:hypothetical protein